MEQDKFAVQHRAELEKFIDVYDRCSERRILADYYKLDNGNGLKGKLKVIFKKAVRKCARFMAEPFLEAFGEQEKFNRASYRHFVTMQEFLDDTVRYRNELDSEVQQMKAALEQMKAVLEQIQTAKLGEHIGELERKYAAKEAHDQVQIAELRQKYAAKEAHDQVQIAELRQKYDKMSDELNISQVNILRVMREQGQKDKVEQIISRVNNSGEIDENGDVYERIDYFKFENHFRGSREAIKNVQKIYLPYFSGKSNVLDIGCGRGEFLELLTENGIKALGIDLYDDYVDFCRLRGLNAISGDAIEYIATLENESIDGLFAAQLAEHLEVSQLVRLCNQAYRKLASDSYVIMETPNPMSLSIYRNAFYLDPSHNKPVHPLLLEYLLKEAGFKEVEILFTESSRPDDKLPMLQGENIANLAEFNQGLQHLANILYGSQDYAVIAKK